MLRKICSLLVFSNPRCQIHCMQKKGRVPLHAHTVMHTVTAPYSVVILGMTSPRPSTGLLTRPFNLWPDLNSMKISNTVAPERGKSTSHIESPLGETPVGWLETTPP